MLTVDGVVTTGCYLGQRAGHCLNHLLGENNLVSIDIHAGPGLDRLHAGLYWRRCRPRLFALVFFA